MKEKLILHRGYKGKYPENSRISFKQALKQEYSFETDIRIYDGQCYLKHDEVLESDKNLCSLQTLCYLIENFGNEKILTFLHIKESKDIESVINILENYDFNKRIKLFGCDEITLDLIDTIKTKHPKYNVGLHFYEDNNFTEKDIKKADFIWADEITKKNITPNLVELTHRLNKPIYVISPELILESVFNQDIEKRWREFLEMNVDGICTDKPDEFLEYASTFKKN